MDVLISGLNNYVGRRCTSLMADEDFRVFAIARNMQLFRKRMSDPVRAQVFEVDLLKGGQGEDVVVPYLEASFYFTQVPALDDEVNLQVELLCLRNFIHLVRRLNCNRLVYVARLMDRKFLQPILDLLQEHQMDYTVVLKNIVVGKDCLLYNVYQQLSSHRVLFYSRQYGGNFFQPIGINDFVCWLKALLKVPDFHYNIVEVGGRDVVSAIDLYGLYRKLKLKMQEQRMVALPNWLLGLIYRPGRDTGTDMAEFLHLLKVNGVVENSWSAQLPFSFSTVQEALQAE